jgi:signal transduction histidine kinase/ActR/RegA family two-component response regulator
LSKPVDDPIDSTTPKLPSVDWKFGDKENRFFGLTLLQGCLSLMTISILIFYGVSYSYLKSLVKEVATSMALVKAEDVQDTLAALRGDSANVAQFIERLKQFNPPPSITAIRVWHKADGAELFSSSGVPSDPRLAPSVEDLQRSGHRVDGSSGRVVQWVPVGQAAEAISVEGDTAAFLVSERRDLVPSNEALIGLPVLVFLALFFIVWRLNVVRLRELSEDLRLGLRRPLPWWASSELILAQRASRHLMAVAKERLDSKRHMIVAMQGVLDEAAEAVIACDVEGCVRVSNRIANQLWSRGGASLVGEPIPQALMDFVTPDLVAGQRSGWADQQHPLERRVVDAEVGSLQATRIPMRLSSHVVFFEGTPWLVIQCLNRSAEISAERAAQKSMGKAKDANQAKSRFLATVSHEIRTPLNGLFGMLDLLSRTELVEEQRDLVDTARLSGRQLRSLLDDVLDLSKIEAGKLEFESVPFDVREQLGRAVAVFTSAAQLKGVTLNTHWHTPVRMLMADVFRISQVLNNLIDNALKFTDQGLITVDIRTEQANPDDALCNLWVTVEDSGLGIPPDRMPQIFEPFAQANESVSRTFGGSGLGLSLCRELCHGMGGHIAAAARPGGGTIFTFLVRCDVAYGMSPFVETQPSEDVQLQVLQGARVLAVDDNRVNQTLLQGWLKSVGASVTQAGDGEAAVAAVIAEPFDIILMDISMPVMNGLDATRAIRALATSKGLDAPRFASVPILGVSAHAMSGDREACIAAGMNGYVTKPIKRDVLFERMVRAMSDVPPPPCL